MFFVLFLLLLMAYPNGRLARKKGRSPALWGFLSILGFFVAYSIMGGIYLSMVYKGPLTQESVKAWAEHNPLSVTLLILFGIGGVLLVRYILERMRPEHNDA